MNTNFLIILGLTFVSFIVPAVCYNFLAQKSNFNRQTSAIKNSFFPLGLTTFITALFSYFFLYNPDDFIGSLNLEQIIIPFIGAFIINCADINRHIKKFLPLILPLAVAVSVAVMPQTSFAFLPQFPFIANALILGSAWLVFSIIFQYANSGEGMLGSQALTFTLGIGLLGCLDALPFMLGVLGWCFSGAFAAMLIFSWSPSRIKISKYNAIALGFLLFSLISPVISEGALSCCVIFSIFFIIDFLWALLLKLTFIPRYNDIYFNMSYQQSVAGGILPEQAASFGLRIQILMLFLGVFQAYSSEPWSLLLISSLLALWLTYRFRTNQGGSQKLRDINSQVIEELQDRVNEFKNYIKKDNEL